MVKKIQIQFLLGVLICLFAISPVWGWSQKITGIVHKETVNVTPTMSEIANTKMTYISCYDAWTGSRSVLDCPYTQEVTGLKEPYEGSDDDAIINNGGHVHDYDTRPYFYPANGELSNAFDTDTDEKIVVSRTYSITGEISHPIPEVGGRIMTETIIEAPTGWECAYGCFTDTSTKYETTLDVAVYEKKVANFLIGWSWYTSTFLLPLTELDDAGGDEHYVKSGQTDTHPLNHYGTSDTIDKLQKIAEEYYKLSGKNLYINDISLPKGGLFDWKATWNPPHVSHRLGTNADIDQKGIPCGENKKLKEATEKVRGNQPYPVLQCEDEDGNFVPDGEFYHYEFD